MSKCFISYKHVKPDEGLAKFLAKSLIKNNHKVFIDTQILIGTKWVEEIEKQIKSSDCFIVLLSPKSILSAMVRQEVKLAHQEMAKRGDAFRIFPIRVVFKGELPYDLGAWLDPIQYALWETDDDSETIAKQILIAIEKYESLPLKGKSREEKSSDSGMKELFDVSDARGAPLPSADPRLPTEITLDTGSVTLDSPFYVERKADGDIMRQIRQKGSTSKVKGSRQMGKSSLLARAHAEAQKIQYQSHYFDFELMDKEELTSLDILFKVMALELAENLNTSVNPDDVWNKYRGPKRNLTKFIEKALLDPAQSPVLILFDEVDRLFNSPFKDDFFSTLRHWHNLRATRGEYWKRMNFIISYSTEHSLWIKNPYESPFNVAFPIKLEDFDFSQVKKLNVRHSNPLKTDEEIRELMDLTGGQPYLVRLALYMMKEESYSITRLNEMSLDDSGPFRDHLLRFVWYLHEERDLKKTLDKILRVGGCDNEEHFHRLKAAGLIRGESRRDVQMRCKLYKDYFKKHF